MQAAYYSGNKSFTVKDIAIPTVDEDQALLEVAYCGICGTDLHVYHGAMDTRVTTNRIIGHEMSGRVVSIGTETSHINVNDKVVVRPLVACGNCAACKRGYGHVCENLLFLGLDSEGAFQQYWKVPAITVHQIPDAIDLAHAALIEPLAVAVHAVRMSRLAADEDVLVIGGGPIGVLIALVAQAAGTRVVVSEPNHARRQIAEQLRLAVLDPTVQDIGDVIHKQTDNKGADLIFEVSGTQAGAITMTAAAAVRARIMMVAIHTQPQAIDLFRFFWREIEMIGTRVYEPEDYNAAIKLLGTGVIDADTFISNIVALDEINEAFQALETDTHLMKTLVQCSNNA